MPDLPVLTGPGMRVRAGNSMGRTRLALLEAALTAIEKHGARKTTMSDVSRIAKVAKGTLYNHFRSKDELYAEAARGAVAALSERAVAVAAADGLARGLTVCAEGVATSGVLARLRADEPAVLGQVVAVAVCPETRAAVGAVLAAAGVADDPAAVDIVLRWLIGHASGAVDVAALANVADRLAAGLRPARAIVELPRMATETVGA